jgi:hypothetical protein
MRCATWHTYLRGAPQPTSWQAPEAAAAVVGRPEPVAPEQRPFEAATRPPAATARVAAALSPSIRPIGMAAVLAEGLASRSLILTTFAVTKENKHRRAAGNDHSANPLRRSDQAATGGISS